METDMDKLEAKDYLAAWTDVISLFLVAFAILVAGIDPRRRVWGRSVFHHILIIFAILINVFFSAARLIFEGVLVETGPREFLLASVAYSARWLWLYVGISRSGTRSRRAFQVAFHLKHLKTIRLGKSTRKPSPRTVTSQSRCLSDRSNAFFSRLMIWRAQNNQDEEASANEESNNSDARYGEKELVIRIGERKLPPGVFYWRGVETVVKTFHSHSNERKTHFVRLVERELHGDHLNVIGTNDFKTKLDVEGTDVLYRKVYDLILTCDSDSSELEVDYSMFLTPFRKVAANTAQAVRVGATLESDLGDVARRIAADACYYVAHDQAECRADLHVKFVNKCLEQAAKFHLGLDSDDQTLENASNTTDNNDSNV